MIENWRLKNEANFKKAEHKRREPLWFSQVCFIFDMFWRHPILGIEQYRCMEIPIWNRYPSANLDKEATLQTRGTRYSCMKTTAKMTASTTNRAAGKCTTLRTMLCSQDLEVRPPHFQKKPGVIWLSFKFSCFCGCLHLLCLVCLVFFVVACLHRSLQISFNGDYDGIMGCAGI